MSKSLIDRILHEDEELEEEKSAVAEATKGKPVQKKRLVLGDILPPLLFFSLALAVRLFFLFKVEDPQNSHPGWYEDAYHHWQIAYLSLKVGFHQGFLRLWDLKGMEYFWGLLHPLILAALMAIFNTPNIILARLLSLTCGTLSIVLVWVLVKRYFGKQAGAAAALLAALNPIAIYSDVSGMQEPLGILMMLTGMLFWPQRAILAGLFWMLAGMVRAEYWLIGIGLMGVVIFARQKAETKVFAFLGYGLMALAYMKYLLDKTGNAIYPMFWNFLGNMKGEWQADILPSSEQLMIKKVYIGILVAVLFFGLWLFRKRPPYLVFFALGLGNWLILSISVGLSKYLLSYLSRFWVDRVMILPYMFLGIWLAVFLFHFLGKKWLSLVAWALVLIVLAVSQLAWRPIWHWRGVIQDTWASRQGVAEEVAQYYQGDKILMFEDLPATTYWLVYHGGIKGENLVGQMFDPYYYMEGDPYLNWGENRKIVLNWLKEDNIHLLAFFSSRQRYTELVTREPQYFEKLVFDPRWNLNIYRVKTEEINLGQ